MKNPIIEMLEKEIIYWQNSDYSDREFHIQEAKIRLNREKLIEADYRQIKARYDLWSIEDSKKARDLYRKKYFENKKKAVTVPTWHQCDWCNSCELELLLNK